MEQLTPNFKKFAPDTTGALNSISRIKYSKKEYFFELLGGLSSEAKSIIALYFKNNYFTLFGDDGGFSNNNIDSFKFTHKSNNYGIGNHGIGLRAALNNLLNEIDSTSHTLPYFCIISRNEELRKKDINRAKSKNKLALWGGGYRTIILSKEGIEQFNLVYEIRKSSYEEVHFFKENSYNKEYGTLFYMPSDDSYFDDNNKKDIIRCLNQHLNIRLVNKEINFYHDYKDLKNMQYSFIPKSATNNIKITIFKNIGNKIYVKFDGKSEFINENKYLNLSTGDYIDENLEISNIIHKFNLKFYNLTNYNNYNIIEHHKKYYNANLTLTSITGFYLLLKSVLVNIVPFGEQHRGNTEKEYTPLFVIESHNINDICRSEANKSKLTLDRMKPSIEKIIKFLKKESRDYYVTGKNKYINPSDVSSDAPSDSPIDVPLHALSDSPIDAHLHALSDSPIDAPLHALSDSPSDASSGSPSDALCDSPSDNQQTKIKVFNRTNQRQEFSEQTKNNTLKSQNYSCIGFGCESCNYDNIGISKNDLDDLVRGTYVCPLFRNGGDGKFTTTQLRSNQYICEYDHITEVRHGGDASQDNCQALCRECHYIKTLINNNK